MDFALWHSSRGQRSQQERKLDWTLFFFLNAHRHKVVALQLDYVSDLHVAPFHLLQPAAGKKITSARRVTETTSTTTTTITTTLPQICVICKIYSARDLLRAKTELHVLTCLLLLFLHVFGPLNMLKNSPNLAHGPRVVRNRIK